MAALFSIPDTRLFGFTSSTLLLGFLFVSYLLFLKYKIPKEYLKFNFAFIFLLIFSIIILLFKMPEYDSTDISYIIARIRDLFSELLFVLILYFIVLKSKPRLEIVRKFIEIYFLLNAIYYVLKLTSKSVVVFFHQSINKVYTLSNFEVGREAFLGWEPSYTVPLSILFCLLYMLIYTNKLYMFLVFTFTIFIFILGLSKTSFIMLFIMALMGVYFYLNNRILNRIFIKVSIIFLFLICLLLILNYLETTFGIFSFDSTDKTEQYKIISFLTRSQLILESGNQLIKFPFGYGLGNSIIVLSNYIDSNIMDFMSSYEIVESTKYTRTPKSQLLEYFLSGGIIFIVLFILHLKFINKILKDIENKNIRQKVLLIQILLLITVLFGERIPYLLIMNILLIVLLIIKENKGYINEK